uniref:Uncharacterized protein n=1 Tax=uncultured marine virus TaxID=186617 RepID=S4TDS6_9VIRU|nr:hypothetical protein [uncultured marine virus]
MGRTKKDVILTTLNFHYDVVMSMVSRGRSRSRSDRGAKRGRSRSISVTSSLSSRGGKWGKSSGDGPTKRSYPRQQTYSMVWDPFPRVQRAILRYNECINFNAAQSAERYFFRAGRSSIQPHWHWVPAYGHDTYANIYNHYRVVKSVCKITNTTSGAGNVMGIHLSDDTAVTSDFNGIKVIKPTVMCPIVTTTEPHSLQMTYNSEAAFPGQSQNTTALFGNNPAEEQYFCIWVTGSNPLADPSAVAIMVSIEYHVEMSELKQLTDS